MRGDTRGNVSDRVAGLSLAALPVELGCVVFDLDGTLIDSQHHIVAAMTAAFRGEGLAAPSPAKVR